MSIQEVLDENWDSITSFPHVLNAGIGTKIQGGKDTGQTCIVVLVSQKVPLKRLTIKEIIPTMIEGYCTDVVELKPEKWSVGETSISKLRPSQQKRRLGLVRRV